MVLSDGENVGDNNPNDNVDDNVDIELDAFFNLSEVYVYKRCDQNKSNIGLPNSEKSRR